jgi:hypothetical protein
MVQKKDYQVFQGSKAAKINRFVLMALFENGCLSAFEIAKKVAELDPQRAKKNWYHEAQKVNSVLTRRGGRLSDLANKDFIEKREHGYALTSNKGFCTALLFYDQIPKPAIDESNKLFQFFPELKRVIELGKKYYPETELEDYRNLKDITQRLLKKGLNLELLSNAEFNSYFSAEIERHYFNEIKDKKDVKNSWVSNPEINEAIMQYFSHLEKILEKQLADFHSTIESIRVNSQGNKKLEIGKKEDASN